MFGPDKLFFRVFAFFLSLTMTVAMGAYRHYTLTNQGTAIKVSHYINH